MLYVGRQLDLRAATVDISAHAGFVQIKLFVFVFFVFLIVLYMNLRAWTVAISAQPGFVPARQFL